MSAELDAGVRIVMTLVSIPLPLSSWVLSAELPPPVTSTIVGGGGGGGTSGVSCPGMQMQKSPLASTTLSDMQTAESTVGSPKGLPLTNACRLTFPRVLTVGMTW